MSIAEDRAMRWTIFLPGFHLAFNSTAGSDELDGFECAARWFDLEQLVATRQATAAIAARHRVRFFISICGLPDEKVTKYLQVFTTSQINTRSGFCCGL